MSKTVYLLCFDSSIGRSKHYLGFSIQLKKRLAAHRAGKSRVPLLREARKRNIAITCVRVWRGATQDNERALKNMKCAPKFCPRCNKPNWKKYGQIEGVTSARVKL